MIGLLIVASAAFTPSPLAPRCASAPVGRAVTPEMSFNGRAAILQATAAVAAVMPAAAFAEGEGINGAFKSAFSDALGPYADSAPIIGTVIFVGIQAVSTLGKKEEEAAEPPPPPVEEEAATPPEE